MVNEVTQNRKTRGNNNTVVDESVNIYANEIVRSLFGNGTGHVKGDFPCYNGRISGRLYIASNAICYYSYFLGFEQKNIILLADVKRLDKVKRNAIQITTTKDEEHLYRSFNDRDTVWAMLDELYKKMLSQKSNKLTKGNQNQSKNNTSSRSKKLNESYTSQIPSEKNLGNNEDTSLLPPKEGSDNKNETSSLPRLQNQGVSRVSSTSSDEGARTNIQESEVDDAVQLLSSPFSTDENLLPKKPKDLKSAWARLKGAYLLQNCLEQVTHNHFFECSIDSCFEYFLADDAKYPMESLQKEKYGDNNFFTTKWKNVEHEDGKEIVSMERVITYAHPNKANMGPAMIHVTQEQKLCWYGQYGIWFWKCIIIQGVPAADCFHVEEEIIFEPKDEGTTMRVQFNIVFKKKTMLRSIIEASTKKQSKQGLLDIVQYMRDALSGNIENVIGNNLHLDFHNDEMKRSLVDLQQRFYNVYIAVFILFIWLLVLARPNGKISTLKQELANQKIEWMSKISSLESEIMDLQNQIDLQSQILYEKLNINMELPNDSFDALQ